MFSKEPTDEAACAAQCVGSFAAGDVAEDELRIDGVRAGALVMGAFRSDRWRIGITTEVAGRCGERLPGTANDFGVAHKV